MEKYNYLKKYINNKTLQSHRNFFGLITLEEINEAESRLGFVLPNNLKEFWRIIGYGALTTSHNKEKTIHNNRILFPEQVADIIILKEDSGYILPEYADLLQEGDIPFFDIGDSSDFLFMNRYAEDKDAIYDRLGRIVAKNMEEFIWRLYYDSPTFYLNIDQEQKKH